MGKPLVSNGLPDTMGDRITSHDRCFAPAAGRNKDVVRDVFLRHVLQEGGVLEVASGTGEHGAHITAAAPGLFWTYSDPDPGARISQAAWSMAADHDRLKGPFDIDASAANWAPLEGATFDAVVSVNMIHIAPFSATIGLFAGASRLLSPSGALFLYGPFARRGSMAPSNVAFDASLRQRNSDWGVRDLDRDLLPLAARHDLALDEVIEMPANNFSLVFRRVRAASDGSGTR